MKKSIYLLPIATLLTLAACGPVNDTSDNVKPSEPEISNQDVTSEDLSTTLPFEIPDDIKFPSKLYNKLYTFLNPEMPYEFGFVFDFNIPHNRIDGCVRVYDYQGFVNDFNDYYYGTFSEIGNVLHFTFTNAKNEEVIKMHYDGKDLFLDEYVYEYSENITYPCKGINVKRPGEEKH